MTVEMQQNSKTNISDRVHPHCVVCSPANLRGLQLEFFSEEDGGVTATFTCDEALEGYPGVDMVGSSPRFWMVRWAIACFRGVRLL